jgi:NADPH-dependent ferric siderophore reductase
LHEIKKIRTEPVRRDLRVLSTQYITPAMRRIVFESGDLHHFTSPSPDDHIKIFLPAGDQDAPLVRDFTPRAWDAKAGTLTLDFALHAEGPASNWARNAAAGDTLAIGGPRGSTIVPDDFDWYLLVGDAAALPSFGRRLEGLRTGVPVKVLALIAGEEERQAFQTEAACEVQWHVSGATMELDLGMLRTALQKLPIPEGEGFTWIACETSIARELYRYAIDTMKLPREWVKANGYWTWGQANAGQRIE